MDNELLIKFLEDKDTFRATWGYNFVDTSFETMPSEFISFAEQDLQSSFGHKYINALSNAKRALDCQADRLLKLFGFYEESQNKFWGFPKKIELIQKFDILAPRVLTKINKTRNLMEHQYVKPDASQVEDFLDIVSLFIASTDRFTSNSITDVGYLNEENPAFKNYDEINFLIGKDKVTISTHRFKPKMDLEFSIVPTDKDYIEILKRHLKKMEFR